MDNEVIAALNAHTPGMNAAKVSTYQVYINQQRFTVELYDEGENAARARFHIEAYFADLPLGQRTDSPAFVIGNHEATIELAVASVRWDKLEAYAKRDQ